MSGALREVCVGIYHYISQNRAHRTGMLRRARFLDIANLNGIRGICLQYG